MVDIFARLDTAHGEVGPHVPKMNPEMWGLGLEQVAGHPSANQPLTGKSQEDLADERQARNDKMYGSKTGGSQEPADKREQREAREAEDARRAEEDERSGARERREAREAEEAKRAEEANGTKREDPTPPMSTPDRHAQDIAEGMGVDTQIVGIVPSSDEANRTTEAETTSYMSQKPIQDPALGPDGDGDVSNDPTPEGDGQGNPAGNMTIQSSPADPTDQTEEGINDASRQARDEAKQATGEADDPENASADRQADEEAAARAEEEADARRQQEAEERQRQTKQQQKQQQQQTQGKQGKQQADEEEGLPSRSALMAMSRDELEDFARDHNVDPEGATKQQIVDTLYSDC